MSKEEVKLSGINCTREQYLEQQLEAAKQENLKLLAVIEKMRKERLDTALDIFVQGSSQALREHEANVLEAAADWFYTETEYAPADGETFERPELILRRMAEERRKK